MTTESLQIPRGKHKVSNPSAVGISRLTEQVLKAGVFGNDDPRTMLLVERILLGKSWAACTALQPPRAKKQGITRLRTSVADSLMALYPDAPRNGYF